MQSFEYFLCMLGYQLWGLPLFFSLFFLSERRHLSWFERTLSQGARGLKRSRSRSHLDAKVQALSANETRKTLAIKRPGGIVETNKAIASSIRRPSNSSGIYSFIVQANSSCLRMSLDETLLTLCGGFSKLFSLTCWKQIPDFLFLQVSYNENVTNI